MICREKSFFRFTPIAEVLPEILLEISLRCAQKQKSEERLV